MLSFIISLCNSYKIVSVNRCAYITEAVPTYAGDIFTCLQSLGYCCILRVYEDLWFIVVKYLSLKSINLHIDWKTFLTFFVNNIDDDQNREELLKRTYCISSREKNFPFYYSSQVAYLFT
jgi:hypothetical protein